MFTSLSLRSFNQLGQQDAPDRNSGTVNIDAYRVSGTHIRDPTFVTTLRNLDTASFSQFTLRESGVPVPVSSARGQAGFGFALSMRTKCALSH